MAQAVEFLFDYGSPNAYLVHRAIPGLRARFEYIPILLGGVFKATGNQSPVQAYGHIAAKRAYDALEIERFCRRHGIDSFAMNPHFPVNTLAIMRGAVAA
ncbi:MAG TPA: 2-hydroxychromene-2-carboxylate isomerase, partial [Novosphingobium sp.]|nr:2-hydroxychromene-2-carboxylate isomerase [Novosphingobium sp.]